MLHVPLETFAQNVVSPVICGVTKGEPLPTCVPEPRLPVYQSILSPRSVSIDSVADASGMTSGYLAVGCDVMSGQMLTVKGSLSVYRSGRSPGHPLVTRNQ